MWLPNSSKPRSKAQKGRFRGLGLRLRVWGSGFIGLRVSSLGFLDVSGFFERCSRFAISVLTPDQHP